MTRRLVSLRRRVAAEQDQAYRTLWEEARRLATEHGAHAWRFAAATDPRERLEFLEFRADADPRREPELAAVLRRLDGIAAANVEEWDEIPG